MNDRKSRDTKWNKWQPKRGGRGIFDGKPPWKPERNREVDKVPCAVLCRQKEGYGGV